MKVVPRADWLEEYSYEESIQILTDLAWSHVQEAGPYRDILGYMLRGRDWNRLCDFKLSYDETSDPVHLQHARQALGFFQKLEPLELGCDKEAVAWDKFRKTEIACAVTNETFRRARRGEFCFPKGVDSVFFTAQRKIARVLGDVPSLTELRFRFGPGATTATKKRFANWGIKLLSKLECSPNTVPALETLAQHVPHWFFLHAHACSMEAAFIDVTVVDGVLQFAPKNAREYRGINKDPPLASFFQQGIGQYIRGCLRHVGVDLDDQSRNQSLAKSGSLGRSLATVDLSSASDTISRELVYELLPLDWACFLETFRSPKTVYKGKRYTLEKFSSMGNAYTFELETLIFWALSSAVLELEGLPQGWLSVYGDDIILPIECKTRLTQVFTSAGFQINEKKTYWEGPFRESCGVDYFKGTDIRPFYQKTNVSGETLFCLHNFYMRQFDFRRAKKVRKYIHPALYIFGPDGYGDGHLVGTWHGHASRRKAHKRGWEGVYFDTLQHRPRKLKRLPDTDWALPTYCIYVRQGAEEPYDPLRLPGSDGYRRVPVYTLRQGVFL